VDDEAVDLHGAIDGGAGDGEGRGRLLAAAFGGYIEERLGAFGQRNRRFSCACSLEPVAPVTNVSFCQQPMSCLSDALTIFVPGGDCGFYAAGSLCEGLCKQFVARIFKRLAWIHGHVLLLALPRFR